MRLTTKKAASLVMLRSQVIRIRAPLELTMEQINQESLATLERSLVRWETRQQTRETSSDRSKASVCCCDLKKSGRRPYETWQDLACYLTHYSPVLNTE